MNIEYTESHTYIEDLIRKYITDPEDCDTVIWCLQKMHMDIDSLCATLRRKDQYINDLQKELTVRAKKIHELRNQSVVSDNSIKPVVETTPRDFLANIQDRLQNRWSTIIPKRDLEVVVDPVYRLPEDRLYGVVIFIAPNANHLTIPFVYYDTSEETADKVTDVLNSKIRELQENNWNVSDGGRNFRI